jgi:hypothetical protein
MRRQPRVNALADPEQSLAHRGRPGAAALFLGDERFAHAFGPSGDETSGLAIWHTDLLARLRLPAFLMASSNANDSGSTNVLHCGQMIEPADLA